MQTVQAYFDGQNVRPLAVLNARKNQLLSITVLDDFLQTDSQRIAEELSGCLHEYANPLLISSEKTAWEEAMEEKHLG